MGVPGQSSAGRVMTSAAAAGGPEGRWRARRAPVFPSPPLEDAANDPRELARWITNLALVEKDRLLLRVIRDNPATVRTELLRRFRDQTMPAVPISSPAHGGRSAGRGRAKCVRTRAPSRCPTCRRARRDEAAGLPRSPTRVATRRRALRRPPLWPIASLVEAPVRHVLGRHTGPIAPPRTRRWLPSMRANSLSEQNHYKLRRDSRMPGLPLWIQSSRWPFS
jgi:hypothetical protein